MYIFGNHKGLTNAGLDSLSFILLKLHTLSLPAHTHIIHTHLTQGPIVGFNPVSYTHDEESTADLEVCIQLFSVGDHPDPITFQLSSVENTAQG